MRAHALSLDNEGLRLVEQAAKLVPPEIRHWLLQRISDELGNVRHPDHHQVHRAVTKVIASAHVPDAVLECLE